MESILAVPTEEETADKGESVCLYRLSMVYLMAVIQL